MDYYILAIDWGGTFIKTGIFSDKGRLLCKQKLHSDKLSHPEDFFSSLNRLIDTMVKNKGINRKSIKEAGIGIPGIIHERSGTIYYLPNIKGWEDFPFKKQFQEKIGMELQTANDANLAALGELRQGAAKGFSNGILFTLGTGLGCGLFLNKKLFKATTSAGEAGHIPLNLKGKKCGCGSNGCIETYIGSKYFVKQAEKIMLKNNTPRNEITDLTPLKIYDLAWNNDPGAIKSWEYFGTVLGKFSAGLVNLLNLEIIILGGAVSNAFRYFYPAMKKSLEESAMYPLSEQVQIKKSSLRNRAALIGAFELAKDKMKSC